MQTVNPERILHRHTRPPEAMPTDPNSWLARLAPRTTLGGAVSLLLLAAVAACASGRGPSGPAGDDEPGPVPGEEEPAREDAEDAATGPATVFLFDRSSSVPDQLLVQSRELTRRRIGELPGGGPLVVRGVGGGDDDGERWTVPRGWPGAGQEDFLPDVRERVVALTETSRRGREARSDLIGALDLLGEELDDGARAGAVVYVFSDMLQVGGDLDFEGSDPGSARAWLERRAEEGELPDLGGVCVVVVGAHEDTVRQRAARSFWEAYFRAAGAVLLPENYTGRMVHLPSDPCPSVGPSRSR